MRTTLFMATSINGYVTGKDDDTGWIRDTKSFYKTVAEFGVCVMGRRTYDECVKYNVFPYKGAFNIVITHDKGLLRKTVDNILFTDFSPKEIIKLVIEKGFHRLLLIGGGHLNGAFLKEGLIDEIILDVHPLVLGEGIRVFENNFPMQSLELKSVSEVNDQIIEVMYKVRK